MLYWCLCSALGSERVRLCVVWAIAETCTQWRGEISALVVLLLDMEWIHFSLSPELLITIMSAAHHAALSA